MNSRETISINQFHRETPAFQALYGFPETAQDVYQRLIPKQFQTVHLTIPNFLKRLIGFISTLIYQLDEGDNILINMALVVILIHDTTHQMNTQTTDLPVVNVS